MTDRIAIKVTSNVNDLLLKLGAFATKQLPFVLAKTFTGLAYDVRDATKKSLPQHFKIRTPWTNNSIKVVPATKQQYPHTVAIVGVRDKILAKNITGGQRDGNSAVPGARAREILNPTNKTLGPRFFPGKILQSINPGDATDKGKRTMVRRKLQSRSKYKNKPFVFTSTKGPSAGEQVIAVRRSVKRLPIDILYVLGNRPVQIKERWPFVDIARAVVKQNYSYQLAKNMDQAMSTIKH